MEASADGFFLIAGIFYLAMIILFIVAYWKIWSKAGFNGAWSLLMLVPLVNLVAFLYLAFAEWPVHRRVQNVCQLLHRPVGSDHAAIDTQLRLDRFGPVAMHGIDQVQRLEADALKRSLGDFVAARLARQTI